MLHMSKIDIILTKYMYMYVKLCNSISDEKARYMHKCEKGITTLGHYHEYYNFKSIKNVL